MPDQLDYSAFHEPLTKVEIDAYKQSGSQKSFIASIPRGKLAYMALIFIVAVVAGKARLLSFVLPLMIITPVLLLWWFPFRKSLLYRARLYMFTVRNNIRLVIDEKYAPYRGMIFANSRKGQITEALQFAHGIEIGNYTYDDSDNRNRAGETWAYVKIPLARNLPHMVLDSKANNIWKFSNLNQSFDRSQKLSLEGDFDSFFTLYAPKQYERDALYIFTPDVMAAVIDSGRHFDMEIIGDELYMYSQYSFPLDTPEIYQALFRVIGAIHSELTKQTGFYADERVGDRAMNVVAPAGQYLQARSKVPYITIGLTLAGIICYWLFF